MSLDYILTVVVFAQNGNHFGYLSTSYIIESKEIKLQLTSFSNLSIIV